MKRKHAWGSSRLWYGTGSITDTKQEMDGQQFVASITVYIQGDWDVKDKQQKQQKSSLLYPLHINAVLSNNRW